MTMQRTSKLIRSAYSTGVFILCIFFAATVVVQAQGITPDHVAKIQLVSGTVISPDGKHIAYTVSVPADPMKENATNSTQLHVLNTDTGDSRPYYSTTGVSQVTFRPNHSSLVFVTRQSGDATNALYELPLNGGEAVKLFSFNSNILGYEWHNDGNHIVFTAMEQLDPVESPLPYSPDFYEENQAQRKAYITNVSRADHTPHEINVEGSVYMMNWSPDASKIAITAAPSPNVDDSFMAQQVMVVDYRTREVIARIDNKGKIGQIEWSPDGTRLALRAAQDINDPIDGRILIVSAEGGSPQIIDRDFKGKYEHIKWSDANTIHFLAGESTATMIGSIRPDGSGKQSIFRSAEHAITSFSRAANGAISFVASSPKHPNEVFFLSTRRNAVPQKMTDSNPWLADLELGNQEVITYTTRDGAFDVDGILIYPVNYTEGESVPLITVVHGGPEAHYSNGWLTSYSVPGQMAAAKGYAVFYPNYRGSTGRGIEFAYSSQSDLAGKEFDDIVDGVDYLIDRGIADADRIGVTGGSYGGYASAWMSTYYSDRFAAAVMFVGISNNISKWGTSDIPEELYLVHSRKRIWDDWQWQLERSPIYYVDRAQTPILIMHGSSDTRVHPAQSMELYRHLKVRKPDLPNRLIYYPGEGHGNIRSGSRYDYNLRMLQWFDTYLMSGDRTAPLPSLDLPVQSN